MVQDEFLTHVRNRRWGKRDCVLMRKMPRGAMRQREQKTLAALIAASVSRRNQRGEVPGLPKCHSPLNWFLSIA
jgi:hypothetical protein